MARYAQPQPLDAKGCLVVLGIILVGSSVVATCGLHACNEIEREAAIAQAEQARQEAADMAAARAADEAEAARKKAEDDAKRAAAQATRAALIDRYSKMQPWQRTAEIARVCSPVMPCASPESQSVDEILANDGDDCCNTSKLSALVESVHGKPEAKTLQTAVDAAKKRHDAAVKESSRGLMCCDGTESPSCLCHGPHQGCCSHHHGVCGCE